MLSKLSLVGGVSGERDDKAGMLENIKNAEKTYMAAMIPDYLDGLIRGEIIDGMVLAMDATRFCKGKVAMREAREERG
jgi:hypothetical protein